MQICVEIIPIFYFCSSPPSSRKPGIQRPTWLSAKAEKAPKPTPPVSAVVKPVVAVHSSISAVTQPMSATRSTPVSLPSSSSSSSSCTVVQPRVNVKDHRARTETDDFDDDDDDAASPVQAAPTPVIKTPVKDKPEVPAVSAIDSVRRNVADASDIAVTEKNSTTANKDAFDEVLDRFDDDDEFGDAAIEAAVSKPSTTSASASKTTASTTNLDSDDEDLFREIDAFL